METLTIEGIAKLAGVSQATVSRVINNSDLVSETTRIKVEQIIKQNNFKPKNAARALANQDMVKTIAVLVSEINNEYFGKLLLGIGEVADELGLQVMIYNTNNSYTKEKAILDGLRANFIHGIIYTPSIYYKSEAEEREILECIKVLKVPVVLVDRTFQSGNFDGVFFDDGKAMYEATQYFIKQGHKNIGIISGDFNGYLISFRDQGVQKALDEAGLEIPEENWLRCDYTVDSTCELTLARFSKPNPPTAFLLGNNQIALGFLKAINQLNLKLNKDVFCIGIDQILTLDYIDYGYSYIERNSEIMGMEAARLLFEKMDKPNEKNASVYIPAPVILKDGY